jgi:hypothetical protein
MLAEGIIARRLSDVSKGGVNYVVVIQCRLKNSLGGDGHVKGQSFSLNRLAVKQGTLPPIEFP